MDANLSKKGGDFFHEKLSTDFNVVRRSIDRSRVRIDSFDDFIIIAVNWMKKKHVCFVAYLSIFPWKNIEEN